MNQKLLLTAIGCMIVGWWIGYTVYNYQTQQSWYFEVQTYQDFNCKKQTYMHYNDCVWLKSMYNYNQGQNWIHREGWMVADSDPCTRYGITCEAGNHKAKRVVSINLSNNKLVWNLMWTTIFWKLRELDLSNNELKWEIYGNNIWSSTKLEKLILNNNQLSGPIPTEIGNLINLQILNLSNNLLNESIPSSITYLNNLANSVGLDISCNNLNSYDQNVLQWMQSKWFTLGTQWPQGCNTNNTSTSSSSSSNGSSSSSSSSSSNGWNSAVNPGNGNNNNTVSIYNSNVSSSSSNGPTITAQQSQNCDVLCYFANDNNKFKFDCSNFINGQGPYTRSVKKLPNTPISNGNNLYGIFTLPNHGTYKFSINTNNTLVCDKTIDY